MIELHDAGSASAANAQPKSSGRIVRDRGFTVSRQIEVWDTRQEALKAELLIERDRGLEIADIDVDVSPVQTHSHYLILTAVEYSPIHRAALEAI